MYSITLGKRVIEEMQRIKQETIINAGADAKAPVKGTVVGVDIGGGRQTLQIARTAELKR